MGILLASKAKMSCNFCGTQKWRTVSRVLIQYTQRKLSSLWQLPPLLRRIMKAEKVGSYCCFKSIEQRMFITAQNQTCTAQMLKSSWLWFKYLRSWYLAFQYIHTFIQQVVKIKEYMFISAIYHLNSCNSGHSVLIQSTVSDFSRMMSHIGDDVVLKPFISKRNKAKSCYNYNLVIIISSASCHLLWWVNTK